MPGWTEEGLTQAWRALAHQRADEDWRVVHLVSLGDVELEAGCHFPASREALVVAFPNALTIDPLRLPQGKGFDVIQVSDQIETGRTSIALVRKPEGSFDIFATIVTDVLRTLSGMTAATESAILDALLERVREWQSFMSKTHRPLSSDGQVGLFGELRMLQVLLASPLGFTGLDCWQGPLRAAQDFHIGTGSIEVKSTIQKGSFLARINSVEQLDSDKRPSFLAAFRFEESSDGTSLVELVAELRAAFVQGGVHRGFDALLMVMGYLDEHAPLYERLLSTKQLRVFEVNGEMPRLERARLPAAVRSAVYVLDLDALEIEPLEHPELLNAFGLN